MRHAIDKAAADFLREMLEGIDSGAVVVVAFAAVDDEGEYSATIRCAERVAQQASTPEAASTAPPSEGAPDPTRCPTCTAPLRRFDSGAGCTNPACGAQFDDDAGTT